MKGAPISLPLFPEIFREETFPLSPLACTIAAVQTVKTVIFLVLVQPVHEPDSDVKGSVKRSSRDFIPYPPSGLPYDVGSMGGGEKLNQSLESQPGFGSSEKRD